MFNLLPENLREGIKKDYNLRKVVLVLIFLIFVQAAFLIFLFPTWLISGYKERDSAGRGEEMNKYLSSLNIASTTSSIKSINSKLLVIDKSLRYPEIIPFINNILSKKTGSIVVTDIIYTATDAKNAQISMQGISTTRESLLSFVKSLEALGLFKSVDLPISNFTKDKDLSFSLNITIERP